MPEQHKGRLYAASLLIAIVCVALLLWSRGAFMHQPADSNRNLERQAGYQTVPTPEQVGVPEQSRLVRLESDPKTGFTLPVIWSGTPPTGALDVRLKYLGNDEPFAVGSLAMDEILCPVPPDGNYYFDFREGGVYSVAHEIRILAGRPSLVANAMLIGDKLPVAVGSTVTIVAQCEQYDSAYPNVDLRWSPAMWLGSHRPEHRLSLRINEPLTLIMPVGAIRFHVDSDKYFVEKPNPAEFEVTGRNDRLAVQLADLVPLFVDLQEDRSGAWVDMLQQAVERKGGPALVIVDAHANMLEGPRITGASRHQVYERVPASVNPALGVDRFELRIPRLRVEATVHASLRIRGGTIVGSGSTAAGPNSSEIRISAKLIEPGGSISATVVDEAGSPVEGVVVVLNTFYQSSKGANRVYDAVGAQLRRTTSADGNVLFEGLPCGEGMVGQLIVDSEFAVIGGNPDIVLDDNSRKDAEIRVSSESTARLRLDISDSTAVRMGNDCTIVILEGSNSSDWRRITVREGVLPMITTIGLREQHVRVIGRCQSCIFDAIVEPGIVELVIDLASAKPIQGRVPIADSGEVVLYPYSLSPSVCWASTVGTPTLPAIELASDGRFSAQLCAPRPASSWLAVRKNGEMYVVTVPAATIAGQDVDLAAAPTKLCRTEVLMDSAKLESPKDIAVIVCPVYLVGPRRVEAEMRLGVRVSAGPDGEIPTMFVPTGRYVLFLSYRDKQGAVRMGFTSGSYAEFEGRDALTTRIRLPIR